MSSFRFIRSLVLPLSLAALLSFFGCGGSSPTEPGVPSSPTATIGGQVVGGGASSSLGFQKTGVSQSSSASASGTAGVKVSVQGTNLSAVTDQQGLFQLAGVPVGNRVLLFEHSNQRADLPINDVKANETIDLVVSLNGSQVQVQSMNRSSGPGSSTGAAAIDIEKSTNGADADLPPGPSIPVGDPVTWEYVVTNTGDETLNNVAVTDSVLGPVIDCDTAVLRPGESVSCTLVGVAEEGKYENLGEVVATPDVGDPVTDTDPSHYFGEAGGGGGDFTVRIQPDAWNTNWVRSAGTVSAKIQGGDLASIELASFELFEDDPVSSILPSSQPRLSGNHVRARFSKAQAFEMLDNPLSGETRTVTIRFVANGATVELEDTVRIVGRSN